MKVNEVISSGVLECYVLGTATPAETAMVNELLLKHPELLREIELIEASLMALSSAGAHQLKSTVKEKILNDLPAHGAKVIKVNQKENRLNLYRFGIAASLLLFMTSLAYNIIMQRRLRELDSEIAQLNSSRSVLAQEMQVQKVSITEMGNQLRVVTDPQVKTVMLKGMNSMEKMTAMVHWNSATEEVYFNIAQMPQSPAGKQYQLWAIIDGKPVDAGMLDLKGRSLFQKMRPFKKAEAFAVTIEKQGGSPVPTMETMCLMGKV